MRIGVVVLHCLLVWNVAAAAAEPVTTKILLVGTQPDHPWGSHMYRFECDLLAKCLRQTPGVETHVSLDWPVNRSVLDGASSIVFYSRPAGEIVLSPEVRPTFERLMAAGSGLVAIHWATGIGYGKRADNEELREAYKNILGGWFRRPPCDIRIDRAKLVQVDADHPVCRGWTGYEIRDEFYLNLIFHERIRPLLSVRVDGRDQTVGWAFQRPNSNGGRSFGITLGHFHENFALEAFRRAIVNGILWTAHRDVPAGGAAVAVEEGDLTLPPNQSE